MTRIAENDEIRMTNDEGITKRENVATRELLRHLVIISAFDIRASSFLFVSIRVHSWLTQ
jgi:hypothetical protein